MVNTKVHAESKLIAEDSRKHNFKKDGNFKVTDQAFSYPFMSKPQRNTVRGCVSAPGYLIKKFQIEAFIPEYGTLSPGICDGDPMGELDEPDIEYIFCPENIADKKILQKIIVEKMPKNIPHGRGRTFYVELIIEIVRFSWKRKMSTKKTLCVTRLYTAAHRYFLADPWRLPAETFTYFREIILRHAVEHPPKSIEILDAEDCIAILTHFQRTYMRLLPVIRSLCLPNFRLRLPWKNIPAEPLQSGKTKSGKRTGRGKK